MDVNVTPDTPPQVRPVTRRWLDDLSISRKLGLIISTFSVIIVILVSFSYFGLSILSDVRGYVGAEGLWSKAQKDAMYHLVRYITFQQDQDFEAYQHYLQVPLGDHKARLALGKPHPLMDEVVAGLVEGRNHPQDVRGMANLFRRYSFVSFIRDAEALWAKGDRLLSELMTVGDEVHRHVVAGTLTPDRQRAFLQRIEALNQELTPLEDRFSYTLGEGARWLRTWLLVGMVILTLASGLLGGLFAFWISRHLIREIHNLRDASNRVARGDFSQPIDVSSRDEIGELAARFGEMMAQRKHAEEQLLLRASELNAANKRLMETERLKNEFFATVSHELRTPLTLVLSPLESMLGDEFGTLPLEIEPLVKTMHNNATRLLQLVTGLLDFSKLEAGRMDVHHEALDLVAVTSALLGDFRPLMDRKGIRAHLQTGASQLPAMVDRYLYERILFNLLSNAAKFTPAGGSVFIDLQWEQGRARLSVRDTGIGISAENQKTLFQKFRQVEGASTRRFEGTGLGLALVKEFSSLMDGTVTLSSTPGEGSSFVVEFQAPAAASEASHGKAAEGRPSLVQRYAATLPEATPDDNRTSLPKVLVVEDNEEMAAYIAEILEPEYRIRIARDGEEGLTLARVWAPNLILSDVMMPKKDGLTLCRELKASRPTLGIPVVLLTALTHREALLKGWEAGADDYLFKPFQARELKTRVRSLLGFTLERQRVEQRMRDLNVELEMRVEERTRALSILNGELQQFAFVAAHDLREPTRRICLFADLLLRQKDRWSADEAGYLVRMQQGAQRLNDLVGALQAYSLVNLPQEPFRLVDLNEALRLAMQDLELRIRETDATIKADVLPMIEGNPAQISQLFQNLLSNAIKFRAKDRPPVISIVSREAGPDRVEIHVADNGIGIEEAYLSHIFQPFKRLHRPSEYEGVGMGLTISQKIVQRHGGTIVARSKPSQGATFVICFQRPMKSEEDLSSLSA